MRFAFYSGTRGSPWGGSEELWSATALELQKRGHSVGISYPRFPKRAQQLTEIERHGGTMYWRDRRWERLKTAARKRLALRGWSAARFHGWLDRYRPDLVVITWGRMIDDLSIAHACFQRGIPYAINLQVANRFQWFDNHHLQAARAAYTAAAACYFVSQENREIVEDQIAARLSPASIVDNAFGVDPNPSLPWPASHAGWRLACVARLEFASKGQDLILRMLRSEKWRRRPLSVDFYGADQGNANQLKDLIELHNLSRHARVAGFAEDVSAIWAGHHALLLASRQEGNALSMIEAMLCERCVIATQVGRSAELINNNKTGFLAAAPTVELLDEAMERAWKARRQWQTIGKRAAQELQQRYSMNPKQDFADRLESLAVSSKETSAVRLAA